MHTALSYDIGIGCIQHRVLSTDRDDAYSIEYGVLIQIAALPIIGPCIPNASTH
jgi:hypothetical protein